MKRIALVICLAGLSPILWADGIPTGTWVRRANKDGISSTMFVEAAGTGQKLTLKVRVGDGRTSTMIVTTQWDGKDAPVYVDGKPSAETMAIRMVDDRHTTTILKMDGKPIATQKSELSADGKVNQDRDYSHDSGSAEYHRILGQEVAAALRAEGSAAAEKQVTHNSHEEPT